MKKNIVRKALDALFKNKKLALILPLVSAAVMLVLSCAFNGYDGEVMLLVFASVIISSLWFNAVYFLLLLFAKLNCPDWYTDSFELIALAAFGASAVYQVFRFIQDTQSFSTSVCLCMIAWSAISLAHNRRK